MESISFRENVFPILGNSHAMALVITTHVFFAFIAIGAFIISVVSEYLGYKHTQPELDRMAKGYMTFISIMVKLNGVLGVIFIILLGLFPKFTEWFYTIFFWPFIVEAIFFLIIMVSSIVYRETWEKYQNRKPIHIAIGIICVVVVTIPAWINNAAWAFMLTPGKFFETNKLVHAVFNPTMIPSALHVFIPCILNAAVLLLLYAYIQRFRKPDSRPYYDFVGAFNARIAAWGILLHLPTGGFYLWSVYGAHRTIFHNIISGIASPFFWVMVGLGIIAFTLSIVYLKLGWERGRTLILIAGIMMVIAFPFGAYNREKARKPFLIYGKMYLNERFVTTGSPVAIETTVKIPTVPEIQSEQPIKKTGERIVQEYNCRVCHTITGRGGSVGPVLTAKVLAEKFHDDSEKIKQFLRSPPGVMPPFDGSTTELDTLATYLLLQLK